MAEWRCGMEVRNVKMHEEYIVYEAIRASRSCETWMGGKGTLYDEQ